MLSGRKIKCIRELFHFTERVSSILCKDITTSGNYLGEQVCLINHTIPSHLNYLYFFKVGYSSQLQKVEVKHSLNDHLKPPQQTEPGEGRAGKAFKLLLSNQLRYCTYLLPTCQRI